MKHYSICLRPFRQLSLPVILPVLLSTFVSCREELCYNHFGEAEVCFQWPETSPSEQVFPEGVTLLVYGDDSGQPTENFISPTGGNVSFGSGKARSILIYNNDTENIRFFGFSQPTTAYATSTPAGRSVSASVRKLHPDEPALNTPDILYAAYIESLPDLSSHEKLDLSFDMKKLVNAYEITYEFEYGGNRVVLARGALAGMAETILLHNGATPQGGATLLYDCDLTGQNVRASVLSFGVPGYPKNSTATRTFRRQTLQLEVKLINGKVKEFVFDVTDQLADQPRGGVIHVSGLRIEDNESSSDSGFDADIDDWGNNEEIDLPVGGQQ